MEIFKQILLKEYFVRNGSFDRLSEDKFFVRLLSEEQMKEEILLEALGVKGTNMNNKTRFDVLTALGEEGLSKVAKVLGVSEKEAKKRVKAEVNLPRGFKLNKTTLPEDAICVADAIASYADQPDSYIIHQSRPLKYWLYVLSSRKDDKLNEDMKKLTLPTIGEIRYEPNSSDKVIVNRNGVTTSVDLSGCMDELMEVLPKHIAYRGIHLQLPDYSRFAQDAVGYQVHLSVEPLIVLKEQLGVETIEKVMERLGFGWVNARQMFESIGAILLERPDNLYIVYNGNSRDVSDLVLLDRTLLMELLAGGYLSEIKWDENGDPYFDEESRQYLASSFKVGENGEYRFF